MKKRASPPPPWSASGPKPKVLIVDGHSMIFQWPELRGLHSKSGAAARDRLVQALTRYQDSTGTHVVAVFDGKGGRTSQDAAQDAVQVFYSKSGQTADSVIERLVATYAERYEITVATDDYLERTTVESFGASWMSSELLAREFLDADRELRDVLGRLKRR